MKKFDAIIPLGSKCITAEVLQKRGLRKFSLPLDWVGPLSLSQAIDLIENRFEGFLSKPNLVEHTQLPKTVGYKNTGNNLLFLHDFPKNSNFDNQFKEVKEKYDRRIKRLYETIHNNHNLLFVHICQNDKNTENENIPPQAELLQESARLKQIFPQKEINLLYVNLNNSLSTALCRKIFAKEGVSLYEAFRDGSVKENSSHFKQFIPPVQTVLDDYFEVSFFYKIQRQLRKFLKLPIGVLSFFIPSKKMRHRLKAYTKRF